MARYQFSDLPLKTENTAYEDAKKRFVATVAKTEGVISVYSIGSVAHPGISDLDMLVLFEDEAMGHDALRQLLSVKDKYLFVHAPYGSSGSLFLEGQQYTFFRPYHLLSGRDLLHGANFKEATKAVRTQVALEYLLRFWFSATMQRYYNLLRVRSILLNAKGAFIDIFHLEPHDLVAKVLYERLMDLRSTWFVSPKPPISAFSKWFDEFLDWFHPFMIEQFRRIQFHLPEDRTYSIARNLTFSKGAALEMRSSVRRLPLLKPLFGRKYFNLLNRFSRFHALVPFSESEIPMDLSAYFDYNGRSRNHNRTHLPGFLPLTNSFHLR